SHHSRVDLAEPNVFFFEAEDGIRDFHVTGVQTCALPICRIKPGPTPATEMSGDSGRPGTAASTAATPSVQQLLQPDLKHALQAQIGRASCRERVYIADGGRAPNREYGQQLAGSSALAISG